MKKILHKFIFLFLFTFAFCLMSNAQTVDCPADKVCISQDDANALYALAQKGKGFDAYKDKAEADIKERDKIIEDLKIKLAMETQRTIDLQADKVQDRAIIQFLLQHGRKKCYGLCVQF